MVCLRPFMSFHPFHLQAVCSYNEDFSVHQNIKRGQLGVIVQKPLLVAHAHLWVIFGIWQLWEWFCQDSL